MGPDSSNLATEDGRTESARRWRALRRGAAIVAFFTAAGPPIGAVAFSILGAAAAWLTGQPAGTAGLAFYGGLLGLPLSWFVGGAQAAASGLAMAVSKAFAPRFAPLSAMAAAALAGLLSPAGDDAEGGFLGLVLAVHVVAAGACAMLAQTIWSEGPGHRP